MALYTKTFNPIIFKKHEDEFEIIALVEERSRFIIYAHDKITNETDTYKFSKFDDALKTFNKLL